jgi:hypothetical protein
MPVSDLMDGVEQYLDVYGTDRIDGVRIDRLA